MQLAIIELLVIVMACAAATVCDSKFGTHADQNWFYNSPWFLLLLGLLCVNLICATLIRWPWRREKWGFVVTHYGIVILLAGAMIGHNFGFETSLRLHTPIPFHETQMAFANHGSIVINSSGSPSGYLISLSVDGNKPYMTLELPPQRREVFGLFAVLGKTVSLAGDSTQFFIKGYWPDFVMGQSDRLRDRSNPTTLPSWF